MFPIAGKDGDVAVLKKKYRVWAKINNLISVSGLQTMKFNEIKFYDDGKGRRGEGREWQGRLKEKEIKWPTKRGKEGVCYWRLGIKPSTNKV